MRHSLAEVREGLARRPPRVLCEPEIQRWAAVGFILRVRKGGLEVMLIRRTDDPRDPWSGHMALPGGRADAGDQDLLSTVVRETQEEVGILLEPGSELLGRLDDLIATARGMTTDLGIAPFVFGLERDPPLALRPGEVAEALWTELEPLHSGAAGTQYEYRRAGSETSIRLPGFQIGERIVWGLTHRMIESFFERLRV